MSSLTSGGGDSGKTGFGCSTIGPRRQGFAAPAQTSWGAPDKRRPAIVALSQPKALSSETSPKQSFSQTRKRCQTHQRPL